MKFLQKKVSSLIISCICMILFIFGSIDIYAAGNAKPNVPELGSEANYKYLEGSTRNGEGRGLFDGTTPNEWTEDTVAYWNALESYVDIEVMEPINIWRSGTTDWSHHNNQLKILKHNGKDFAEDVTDKYSIATTQITNTSWEKFINNLPEGKYRFKFDKGLRLDSEWYCEKTEITEPTQPIKSTLAVLLEVDETAQLSVTSNLEDNKTLIWSSMNEDVATVDKNGKVKAIGEGLTQIYAQNEDGSFKEYINIRVVAKGEAEELRLALNLNVGKSQRLYLNDDYENIEWTSQDKSIATIDKNGKVKAVSEGLVIINATYKDETQMIYVRVTE